MQLMGWKLGNKSRLSHSSDLSHIFCVGVSWLVGHGLMHVMDFKAHIMMSEDILRVGGLNHESN